MAQDFKQILSMRDKPPVPTIARTAEDLWENRLRGLGWNTFAMQSSAVGSHGPDMVAFKIEGGRFRLMIGEVKGLRSSRVLSALGKLQDRTIQMSAAWIDRYASAIADNLVDGVFDMLGGSVGGLLGGQLEDRLREVVDGRSGMEYYLLRARHFGSGSWQLRGFRLLQVGRQGVGVDRSGGDPQIESYYNP